MLNIFDWYISRTAGSLRILAYHGISAADSPLNADGFFVHPETFRNQMRWISRHLNPLSLTEALDGRDRENAFPERSVVITFDDGYANNYGQAAPILEEFSIPAVFFITTNFIDKQSYPWWFRIRALLINADVRKEVLSTLDLTADHAKPDRNLIAYVETAFKQLPYEKQTALQEQWEQYDVGPLPEFMTWDQVSDLQSRGHEIGGHSRSHRAMSVEDHGAVEQDVEAGLRVTTEHVGTRPSLYSLPYGMQATKAIEWETHGIRAVVTTDEGLNLSHADVFELKRLNVTGRHRGWRFAALASGLASYVKNRIGTTTERIEHKDCRQESLQ